MSWKFQKHSIYQKSVYNNMTFNHIKLNLANIYYNIRLNPVD